MNRLANNAQVTRPFLKWAGNKYRLLDKIKLVLPEGRRLIEPFSGAAATFLNTDYRRTWLNDLNVDLINVYRHLSENENDFINFSESFFTPKNNQEKRYYQLREHFNSTQDGLEKSALFLYLNRHSYNGLCRYNRKGGFNAPFGRYKKPYFPKQQLEFFAGKTKSLKLTHQSFEKVMLKAKTGDVVYCDPPYVPLTTTANFTQYSYKSFVKEDQERLAELANELSAKGIPVIVSNHDTPFTRKIYAGAKINKFTVPRYISCKGNQRVAAKELLAVF